MTYTAEELQEKFFGKIYKVYDIFKDFFGEENVDLQGLPTIELLIGRRYVKALVDGKFEVSESNANSLISSIESNTPSIMVHWPKVTVTNEYDKSIVITDLFAKIPINGAGKIPMEQHGFLLNRSSYSALQFKCGYIHSHVPTMRKEHLSTFQQPCLGRGPILRTIASLKMEFNETMWMLFCQELDMYVTVESIAGVPYFRLETVKIGNDSLLISDVPIINPSTIYSKLRVLPKDKFLDFMKYYIKNGNIKLNFINGNFHLGMEYNAFLLDVSNAFIKWYNEGNLDETFAELVSKAILQRVIVSNRNIYNIGMCPPKAMDFTTYIGMELFQFKNENVLLNIFDEGNTDTQDEETIILNNGIAEFVLGSILRIVNYRYRNDYKRRKNREEAAPIGQRVYYI